ncbi:unnamed protein product [Miscanthus lutarioriparius]|uniref:Uncharacterized protein n=1 Tax=Miscanthus lutarioriparius TaxID=422564 RepID=A0A811N5P6_9POAL|nr:unnamed protein product [Miscanthus lutarioriparius]
MAARRQRQEEDERLRREAHDGRVAKEYAQNVSAWSTMRVAEVNGLPFTSVPAPIPPPPVPPVYADVPSSNPSPNDLFVAFTMKFPLIFNKIPFVQLNRLVPVALVFGIESPEETLSRIAQGRFRSHENAGNYKRWWQLLSSDRI